MQRFFIFPLEQKPKEAKFHTIFIFERKSFFAFCVEIEQYEAKFEYYVAALL